MWTQEQVELLKTLASQGVSYGVIAQRLGMTRNSVIGKASREKLPPRIGNIREAAFKKRIEKAKRMASRRVRAQEREREKALRKTSHTKKVIDGDQLLAIIALPTNNFLSQKKGHCKWPHGDLCQNRALEMRPYCAEHEARSRA